ncbi:MAG: alpha/beta hydrolase [Hyphomicrobiaceae bacterium]|nr:alpha/beta hydrolase [Hyphomicrobiaceae bacterium]
MARASIPDRIPPGRPAPELVDRSVTLADGRRVAYRELGHPAGFPVIALHGTPGSRLKYLSASYTAERLGIRIIAPDRWGYGATDSHRTPSLRAYPPDICELADRLGVDRFAVMGVSGGGPYATAIATSAPSRVTALALVAPVGPIYGEDDDEISAFHRLCFGALPNHPAAVAAIFGAFRGMLKVSPGVGMRMAMVRVAPVDRQALRVGDTARLLGRTFVEGLRPGTAGPVTDMVLFGAPWGLELQLATMPSRVWLGTADRNVPRSAARRLAHRLPACTLVELPQQGHLWIAHNYETVLGWLAELRQAVAAPPSHV